MLPWMSSTLLICFNPCFNEPPSSRLHPFSVLKPLQPAQQPIANAIERRCGEIHLLNEIYQLLFIEIFGPGVRHAVTPVPNHDVNVYIVNYYNFKISYIYNNNIVIIMTELKRVNVVIPDESHQVLLEFQRGHGLRSKDKALADLLLDYKRLKGSG